MIAGAAAALSLAAVQRPSALSPVKPGLWELAGVPGTQPLRLCVTDMMALGHVEHRSRACTQRVLRDRPSTVSVDYTCAKQEFGRSEISVLTPRSLRIDTQGIAGGLPFAYVVQARRVGECAPARNH